MLQENQGYGLHEENADYKVVEEIGTAHCQRIMLKLGGSHQTFEVVQVRLTRLAKQIVSIPSLTMSKRTRVSSLCIQTQHECSRLS